MRTYIVIIFAMYYTCTCLHAFIFSLYTFLLTAYYRSYHVGANAILVIYCSANIESYLMLVNTYQSNVSLLYNMARYS